MTVYVFASLASLVWLGIVVCWIVTGKFPPSYDMFKSIKLVELQNGKYEVHVYHSPFRNTATNLAKSVKWFTWYKVTSKLDVHRLDSPFAEFSNRGDALDVIDKIKSKTSKVEYF